VAWCEKIPTIMTPAHPCCRKDGWQSKRWRESSLMILNGSIITVGLMYVPRYQRHPARMPNKGTAMNTQRARAAVVESEPVGGLESGRTMHTLHVPMKRKSVASRKERYLRGSPRPTSLICPSMPSR